jgi:hypothetical protein
MKPTVAITPALLALAACLTSEPAFAKAPATPQPQESRYGGGDGLSKQHAVIIHAGGQDSGTEAEYSWIKSHYPGSTPISQALTPWDTDGKRYQRITIHTGSGDSVDLWFEISALFRHQ